MNKLLRTIVTLLLVGIICWISFTCVGCNVGGDVKREHIEDSITIKKKDTTRSLGLYKSATEQELAGFIYKVRVPDTQTLKLFPDGALRERGGTDSFYIIPTIVPDYDSLGIPKKDSLGKIRYREVLIDTDKKWVIAEIPYVDSLLKQLKKLK